MNKPWFKRTLFSLIAIIIIVLALPVAILNSTWALDVATKQLNRLDNLTINYQEGTLFNTLILTDIELIVPGWNITVAQLSTGLSLDCAWEQQLCFTSLQILSPNVTQTAHAAEITVPETDDTVVTLPFPINIKGLEIADLTVALLDKTQLTTALNIPNIDLKTGPSAMVWLDIAPVVIDIPILNVVLPISSHQLAQHSPNQTSNKASNDESINALINTLHQQISAVTTQYQYGVNQWQGMMQAPKAWLQAQSPIEIPINLETLTLNVNNISLSNLDSNIQMTNMSLDVLASVTPDGITSAVDIAHPKFSLNSQVSIEQDWTHNVDTQLQWQTVNITDPLGTLSMQPGSLSLKGDIGQWQITTQANITVVDMADFTLSDNNWKLDAQGNQQGIMIHPSALNVGPYALEISGKIPATTNENVALAIRFNTLQPYSVQASLKVDGALHSPVFSGNVTVKEIQQPQVDVHVIEVDFAGDLFNGLSGDDSGQFPSLSANVKANWTHPNTMYSNGHHASASHTSASHTNNTPSQKPLTGQYTQALSIKLQPEEVLLSLDKMRIESPLGHVSLSPYRIELIPGYLRGLDTSPAFAGKAKIDISQWQLNLQNQTNNVVGTWQIEPINLILNDSLTDYFIDNSLTPITLNITTLHIQSLLNLANPFLAKPITTTTDANINGDAQLTLAGNAAEPQLNITAEVEITPSDWQITPKLDASITQANVALSAQYRLYETPNRLSLDSTGTLIGERLGDIQYQMVMAEKLTLYTQIKSINLGLVAPFLPQFTRFTGNTSANIALTKDEQLLSLNGIIIVPELDVQIEQLDKSAITPHGDIIITDPVEQGFSRPNAAFIEAPLDLLANIRVLIDPLQQDKVKVAGFDFSTHLQGSVEFYLEKQQPSVIGSISLNNGQYQAYGQDLLIRNGQLIFNGPASLPFIQLEAIRNPKNMDDDVIAGLKISGIANQLDAQLFSEPLLENPNILSYLIRGKDLNDDSQEDNSVLLTNAILGFGLGKSQEAISEFGDKIGVENLQLSTQGQGNNAQLGISGQINDRLSVEYRVGVFNAIAEFGLRYQWLPNLYVEATSGAENALDVFYQLSWGKREPISTKPKVTSTQ